MNHNVKIALHWSLWENFSASVRSGDVLSAYLYLLTNNNSVVGYVQGANGVLQLLTALPAGLLSDQCRRGTVLRLSALAGLLAGCFFAATMLLHPGIWNICVAMALMGCYRGFYNPPLESIFADSVAPGRSWLYTVKYVITVLASGCGPLLSLLLFWRLGDQWKAADCRHVLLWGLATMAVPLLLMCFFDDDRVLKHQQELSGNPLKKQAFVGEGPAAKQSSSPQRGGCFACFSCCGRRCCFIWAGMSPGMTVTLLLSFSDLLGALASGMTLKFFALFFMQACQVSPMVVSLLGALSPLGISAASMLSQRVSRMLGRVQVSIVTRAADVVLLVAMAYLPTVGTATRQRLMCLHLLRMAMANCTRPLLRSVLMDAVPRQHRGKVNAVDSVRTFSWSGSAALGGFLIEKYGFQATFLITAAIKLGAFIPLMILLRYVPDGWLAGGRVDGGSCMEAGSPASAGYSMLPECAADVEIGGEERVEDGGTNGIEGFATVSSAGGAAEEVVPRLSVWKAQHDNQARPGGQLDHTCEHAIGGDVLSSRAGGWERAEAGETCTGELQKPLLASQEESP